MLNTQELQMRQNGVRNDEEIAKHYIYAASSCQMWATVLALRDQRAAEQYIDDEDS